MRGTRGGPALARHERAKTPKSRSGRGNATGLRVRRSAGRLRRLDPSPRHATQPAVGHPPGAAPRAVPPPRLRDGRPTGRPASEAPALPQPLGCCPQSAGLRGPSCRQWRQQNAPAQADAGPGTTPARVGRARVGPNSVTKATTPRGSVCRPAARSLSQESARRHGKGPRNRSFALPRASHADNTARVGRERSEAHRPLPAAVSAPRSARAAGLSRDTPAHPSQSPTEGTQQAQR